MATYELAVSESSRLCAKLENIFVQMRHHLNQRGFASRHLALESVLNLMQVLDRPDIRARLVQALQVVQDYLGGLLGQQQVDSVRLRQIIVAFDEDLSYMHATNRLGNNLFNDALLMLLRSHINAHGQAAYQLSPICQLWQLQDAGLNFSCFQRWIEPLLPLERAVLRLMKFMREHYKSTVCEASNGFSKWDIPKDEPIFMVGISVPNGIVPAISSGQKLISVTFHTALWGDKQILEQYTGSVRFEWMVCSLSVPRRRSRL